MTTLPAVFPAFLDVARHRGGAYVASGRQGVFHVHVHVVPRFADDGFTSLDRSLASVEVSLEERLDQARTLSEALARHTDERWI